MKLTNFKPRGKPLPEHELLKLARITTRELNQAIATSNQQLKPFLVAQKWKNNI